METCAQNGCYAAFKSPQDDEDDILKDPDYIPGDEGLYSDPEEYDSEYESVNAMSISGDDDDTNRDSNYENEGEEIKVDPYLEWLAKTLNPQSRFPGEPVGILSCSTKLCQNERIIPIHQEIMSDEQDPEILEHIPNRACTEANAYSGFAISLDEMRGCRTAQFLVHHRPREDGRQTSLIVPPNDWEVSEDWFLSGLSDGVPSRDCDYPSVWPFQGEGSTVTAENVNFNVGYSP